MRAMVATLVLPLFFKRQSMTEAITEISGRPLIPHSVVRRHKRKAIQEACTSQQIWHRKVGLVAMYTCLMAFVGLILGAIQFTVPAAYHDLLQYAIMASFFGVAISWMYRDTFHPGRWEVHQSHLYASSERHFPDDVAHLGERVRSGLPGGEPEIHRHGTDPFLAIVLSWWIFGRTFFIVEFDDNGIVAN